VRRHRAPSMMQLGAPDLSPHFGGALAAAGALAMLSVSVGAAAIWVLEVMHASVGDDRPTQEQLAEEDPAKHALFRHIPALQSRLAWRQLGTFPTPVHRASCRARTIQDAGRHEGMAESKEVRFWVKREDLSSSKYGGNKVRTLQHQLAVIEAKNQRALDTKDVVVFGSGGSNQVVATLVHASQLKPPMNVSALWIADPPDMDNTLNMLSALSLRLQSFATWASPLALTRAFLRGVFGGSFVLPLGGNNPVGVLGQVSGALELAEQIEDGEVPDVEGIYVAVGSSCTVSGLIVGVALSRHLGLAAFSSPSFAIRLVPIHDVFSLLNRATGLNKSSWSR